MMISTPHRGPSRIRFAHSPYQLVLVPLGFCALAEVLHFVIHLF
jgi:hypothetical protein